MTQVRLTRLIIALVACTGFLLNLGATLPTKTHAHAQPQLASQASFLPALTPIPTESTSSKGIIPFSPMTITDFGPVSSNAPIPGGIWVSGDWVVYVAQNKGCGHCNYYKHTLYVQHVINGSVVQIRAAVQSYPLTDNPKGMDNVVIGGTMITWTQPARPPASTPQPDCITCQSLSDYFRPGTYDCTTCYYEMTSGQAGSLQGGGPSPNPPIDWQAQVSSNLRSIKVTQKSTGKTVIDARLGGYDEIRDVALGVNKMVFYQMDAGNSGHMYLKLVWLLTPDPALEAVWAKADLPVASGKASRSWLWGPAPLATAWEQYKESKLGWRLVQYYDKSRMEINNPNADPRSPGYVTNGLLAAEMIGRVIQVGDVAYITANVPCTIPVAGDPRKDNPLTPGYDTLSKVASLGDGNESPRRVGQKVDDSINVNGVVGKDPAHASIARYAAFISETEHNIPDLFWKYLGEMRGTYGFDWTFVVGYPITEAYWTKMRVSGKDMPVLIQAYQRRVLTYVPDFPPAWRIQQGNVGQHYLEWRTTNLTYKLPRPDLGP